ncbi:Copper chaperone CopZ [Bowdeniella nasicola]|uniref:Copper chaperone CopZ n=1 Tax=Bowdeniella nasicola TaxID=208480 RepID=A0A1H3XXD5_9ACTO|nr:heavy metal-associated domain-containing protein [Bowdeniella nasicola]SEA04129.1 Copper chaperone CopZ [Bowdeniella nasicola]
MFDRTIVLKIDGMTCGNCAQHVTDELEALEHVDNVVVTLDAKGTSTVTAYVSAPVEDDALREAIEEAGDYTLLAIERDF